MLKNVVGAWLTMFIMTVKFTKIADLRSKASLSGIDIGISVVKIILPAVYPITIAMMISHL